MLTSDLKVDSVFDSVILQGAVVVAAIESTGIYKLQNSIRLDGKTLALAILPALPDPCYLIGFAQILRPIVAQAGHGYIFTDVYCDIAHRYQC